MPRARDPNRDKAYQIWKKYKGDKKLKDIAAELGVSDTQIRKWKSQDKWEQTKGNVTNSKRNVTKKDSVPVPVVGNKDLNDQRSMFCLYYLKYFNATKAYQKVYGCDYKTANANGSRLLAIDSVKREIERLKAMRQSGVFLDGQAVLQKYIDIAFADITDFLTFGRKEIEVDMDGNGDPIMKEVNYVEFANSHEVDGTLISEVKQGKDGVSVKLEDKMKALDKLSLYFDLFPDKFKREVEQEKLKLAQRKVNGEDEEEYEDDGFLEALDGKEVSWDEET